MPFVDKANNNIVPIPVRRGIDQRSKFTATIVDQQKSVDTFSEKDFVKVQKLNPEKEARGVSSRFDIFAEDIAEVDDDSAMAQPSMAIQNQSTNDFARVSSQEVAVNELLPSKREVIDNKKESKLSPELAAIEKIAPGWGQRLAMIDPEKDPETNRLMFDQLLADFDQAQKDGKLKDDPAIVITAALKVKFTELKSSKNGEQYVIKQEKEQNLALMKFMLEAEKEKLQFNLELIRIIMGGEAGGDSTGELAAFQNLVINNAENGNKKVVESNEGKIRNARKLDKAIHTMALDNKDLAEAKTLIRKKANSISFTDKVEETAALLKQGVSPIVREKLIQKLASDIQELIPGQQIDKETVESLLQAKLA